jgi:hypothetical protein
MRLGEPAARVGALALNLAVVARAEGAYRSRSPIDVHPQSSTGRPPPSRAVVVQRVPPEGVPFRFAVREPQLRRPAHPSRAGRLSCCASHAGAGSGASRVSEPRTGSRRGPRLAHRRAAALWSRPPSSSPSPTPQWPAQPLEAAIGARSGPSGAVPFSSGRNAGPARAGPGACTAALAYRVRTLTRLSSSSRGRRHLSCTRERPPSARTPRTARPSPGASRSCLVGRGACQRRTKKTSEAPARASGGAATKAAANPSGRATSPV